MSKKNLDIIDKIISAKHDVNVRGEVVTLVAPSVAATQSLFKVLAAQGDLDRDDAEGLMRVGVTIGVEAIRACIPGLSQDKAERLLIASGGVVSNLTAMAMSLCGLDNIVTAGKNGVGSDRPT